MAGEGGEAEGMAAGVEEEDRAEAAGHKGEGLAGSGLKDGLKFEFGNEALAGGDEGFELAGLDAELSDEPEAADDLGGFAGEQGEDFLLGVPEGGFAFAVHIDDADDEALDNHGDGHFGADGVLEFVVAGVGADIGDDQGAAMEGDPAGDALANREFEAAGAFGEAAEDLDLEALGVGVDEGDGGAGGGEGAHDLVQNEAEGLVRVFGFANEAGDVVEGVEDGLGIVRHEGREFKI